MTEWSLGLVPRDHIAGESYPERIRMRLLTRTFTPELVDFVVDEARGARGRPADDNFGLGCYWARLKNASGELGAIIANDNITGQA
ncbi:hypothetical protein OHA79_02750 [Streptomyces sp. NBC_00841]|uniref:hypothetical protein n=1 Tax=Streptomyces sp. NBC_00841 TaxID=2975847 RepID=UPI002DDC7AE8|nr:hypothetical protein [Streptomyces sp. NBC_00841]WRZ96940.1 hypothetical protein OHA79_02750 [Streptomyces sp. NBC_00841]